MPGPEKPKTAERWFSISAGHALPERRERRKEESFKQVSKPDPERDIAASWWHNHREAYQRQLATRLDQTAKSIDAAHKHISSLIRRPTTDDLVYRLWTDKLIDQPINLDTAISFAEGLLNKEKTIVESCARDALGTAKAALEGDEEHARLYDVWVSSPLSAIHDVDRHNLTLFRHDSLDPTKFAHNAKKANHIIHEIELTGGAKTPLDASAEFLLPNYRPLDWEDARSHKAVENQFYALFLAYTEALAAERKASDDDEADNRIKVRGEKFLALRNEYRDRLLDLQQHVLDKIDQLEADALEGVDSKHLPQMRVMYAHRRHEVLRLCAGISDIMSDPTVEKKAKRLVMRKRIKGMSRRLDLKSHLADSEEALAKLIIDYRKRVNGDEPIKAALEERKFLYREIEDAMTNTFKVRKDGRSKEGRNFQLRNLAALSVMNLVSAEPEVFAHNLSALSIALDKTREAMGPKHPEVRFTKESVLNAFQDAFLRNISRDTYERVASEMLSEFLFPLSDTKNPQEALNFLALQLEYTHREAIRAAVGIRDQDERRKALVEDFYIPEIFKPEILNPSIGTFKKDLTDSWDTLATKSLSDTDKVLGRETISHDKLSKASLLKAVRDAQPYYRPDSKWKRFKGFFKRKPTATAEAGKSQLLPRDKTKTTGKMVYRGIHSRHTQMSFDYATKQSRLSFGTWFGTRLSFTSQIHRKIDEIERFIQLTIAHLPEGSESLELNARNSSDLALMTFVAERMLQGSNMRVIPLSERLEEKHASKREIVKRHFEIEKGTKGEPGSGLHEPTSSSTPRGGGGAH